MNDAVVDASLAVKRVIPEDHSAEADALLQNWQTRSIRRVVPSWFACEIGNVLYKRMLKRTLTLVQAQGNLEAILSEVVVLDFEPKTAKRGLELAQTFGRSASYDAHYLALAEHLGCELWTADEKFWNATKGTFKWVRWVGEVVV